MHSSILLVQLFTFYAIASPVGQLLAFNAGDNLSDTTSYAEPLDLFYQVAGGLVPERQSAELEVNAPVNQLAQPFACTTTQLPEPACCPQNVYITADPNCIPYTEFPGRGCERNDGVMFRGACCLKFDPSGGIMCQDPSVATNIPQVIYENINEHYTPSQQTTPP